MIGVEQYLHEVLATVETMSPVCVPLHSSLGLVLCEDVKATRDVPGFANSSMDGYAVIAADVTPGQAVSLRVTHDIAAGSLSTTVVVSGTAARIMTGAPLPAGADCVVPVERTDAGVDTVVITAEPHAGDYIRRPGEDLRQGQLAIPAGTELTSRTIGLAAACDRSSVNVYERPIVAVISTGDELVPAGQLVDGALIADSNGPLLAAAVMEAGGIPVVIGPVADSPAELGAALDQAAAQAHLIITSGGVSMGAYDVVKSLLAERGGVTFCKVAMQPGMPQGHGHIGNVPIITLPGNPVSSYVSFEVFVRPVLRKLLGHSEVIRPRRHARLTHSLESPRGRTQFARGVLSGHDDLSVTPVCGQASHMLGGLGGANCLLVIAAESAHCDAGDIVQVIDLR